MSRVSPVRYAAFLAALVAVLGGIALAKGGLYVDRHEGDTAHMVDIIARMLAGQTPHIDFSTPIGLLSFLPVAWAAKLGFGIGQGFIVGQIIVALVLLPMVWRVGTSRLGGLASWLFGLVSISLTLALVHGEDVLSISVSMYYNRWAWAMAFVAILLAVLPNRRDVAHMPLLDGVFIGVALTFMALSKPTYFVAFFPPILLALILRSAWRSIGAGLVTGVAAGGLLAVIYGFDIYTAYISDLLLVTGSDTRAAPGAPLVEIINGPRFLVATITAILSVIVLRQSGATRAGLLLLLLIPGFVFVTFQNFGNDPKWLLLLSVFLMAQSAERGRRVIFNVDAKSALGGLALVAFALTMPSFQNILTSPFRHFSEDTSGYTVQIAGHPKTQDIFVYDNRSSVVVARRVLADDIPALAAFEVASEGAQAPSFLGETLPRCSLFSGDAAMDRYIADRLHKEPMNFPEETQFFVADVASMVWMIGGFAPLEGGAPWYYAGTPGVENADAILIPMCPLSASYQKSALKALEHAGLRLSPPIKDAAFWIYPVVRDE